MPKLIPQMYGLWVPGQGWWKINGRAYAETDKAIARRFAKWVGHRARVEPIDKSLEEAEQQLLALETERRNRWKGWFKWIKS